ncbi:MAG: hypothetical protein QOH87_5309 [Trebonia sp.]|jgi:hypothetical protein|nr:hypothetical protein [Trebonia sp.]
MVTVPGELIGASERDVSLAGQRRGYLQADCTALTAGEAVSALQRLYRIGTHAISNVRASPSAAESRSARASRNAATRSKCCVYSRSNRRSLDSDRCPDTFIYRKWPASGLMLRRELGREPLQSHGVPTQCQVANWAVKKMSITVETAISGRTFRCSTAQAPSHMKSGKRRLA